MADRLSVGQLWVHWSWLDLPFTPYTAGLGVGRMPSGGQGLLEVGPPRAGGGQLCPWAVGTSRGMGTGKARLGCLPVGGGQDQARSCRSGGSPAPQPQRKAAPRRWGQPEAFT